MTYMQRVGDTVNITLPVRLAEELVNRLAAHVDGEADQEARREWLTDRSAAFHARYHDAEDMAAHERSEDPEHYFHKASARKMWSLDVHYAAKFARQLNERFGDEEVGPCRIVVNGWNRMEWSTADAEPGTGILSKLPYWRKGVGPWQDGVGPARQRHAA
jgi:hypothetical protein